ncbi:MAG: hypothetical protein F6K35_12055 [Okeania sp. SIO2H7]|nr:hypothetical protein [Okeania sp. SIO2H7]
MVFAEFLYSGNSLLSVGINLCHKVLFRNRHYYQPLDTAIVAQGSYLEKLAIAV